MKNLFIILFLIHIIFSCTPIRRINAYDKTGLKNGLWVTQKDSSLVTFTRYRHGKINGRIISRDIDGNINSSGRFRNGMKTGKWKFYTEGRVYKTIYFKNDSARKIKLFNLRPKIKF